MGDESSGQPRELSRAPCLSRLHCLHQSSERPQHRHRQKRKTQAQPQYSRLVHCPPSRHFRKNASNGTQAAIDQGCVEARYPGVHIKHSISALIKVPLYTQLSKVCLKEWRTMLCRAALCCARDKTMQPFSTLDPGTGFGFVANFETLDTHCRSAAFAQHNTSGTCCRNKHLEMIPQAVLQGDEV